MKKIQPFFLFKIIERAFDTAQFGYFLHKTADFKKEAVIFAKAAEKFENILGIEIVNEGIPNKWKIRYQNFENWFQSDDAMYAASSFQ